MCEQSQHLILVDPLDRPIGSASKEDCHRRPLLHRAFSVFLYHDNALLLQRRVMGKYHSGGLWTNACCSHPRSGESLMDAVQRRLQDELGIVCPCRELTSFVYHHAFGPDLYEYEYDHVFIGMCDKQICPNPEEIMETCWVTPEVLMHRLQHHPELFTAWFLTAAPMVLRALFFPE